MRFDPPTNQKVGAGRSIAKFQVIHHGLRRNSEDIQVSTFSLDPDHKDGQKLRGDVTQYDAI
jgi:hypothetical protein